MGKVLMSIAFSLLWVIMIGLLERLVYIREHYPISAILPFLEIKVIMILFAAQSIFLPWIVILMNRMEARKVRSNINGCLNRYNNQKLPLK